MKGSIIINYLQCLKFRRIAQVLYILTLVGATQAQVWAFESKASRGPANFVPNDEVGAVPFEQKIWLEDVLVEDNGGVLDGIRSDVKAWEEKEEYARLWNVKSTGLYETPTAQQKKAYFDRKLLKYIDKRLSGEIKDAEEGSALHTVGQVHQAVRPAAEAQVSKHVTVKFKARVLQGKGYIIVKNPIAEYTTTLSATGGVKMNLYKDIKPLGIKANIDYEVSDEVWVASFDRALTENISARLTSAQSDKDMAFSKNADKSIQFYFNHAF